MSQPRIKIEVGSEWIYQGKTWKGMIGCRVKVVNIIRDEDDPTQCWLEIVPWIEEEGRWSFVGHDCTPEDLSPIN